MRVAITGNIGSGKSLFGAMLSERLPDRAFFDADSVSNQLYQDPAFLSAVEAACGSRDRKEVSRACFSDPAVRRRVELASLPLWSAAIESALAPANLIVEFPLLLESAQYAPRFDLIVCARAQDAERSARVTARSGWESSRVQSAFKAQLSSLAKAGAADVVIENDGSIEELALQADRLARDIRAFESLNFSGLPAALPRHIARAYMEPQRRYHTLAHLAAIERALAPHWGAFHNVTAARLALFFHDYAYFTALSLYPSNEALSIQGMWRFASDFAPELLAMDPDLRADCPVTLASEMIGATKRHAVESPWLLARAERAADCALFLDADLSVLASEPAELLAYDDAILAEFAAVPREAYKTERIKALSSFLARPLIFLSPQFAPLEAKARANLALLIQRAQELS